MRSRLYHILASLCPEAPESLVRRLLYTLYHYHQVAPLHRIAPCVLIILRHPEASNLKTLDIHHHATVLGMKQLHQFATRTDKDKHVAIAY